MYEFGATIDSRVNLLSGWFACFAYCGSLSRSGPIVPCEAAGVYVWQPLQPFVAKRAFPGAASRTVPTIVFGSGCVTPWAPHPAAVSTITTAANRTTGRPIAREATA